MSFVSCEAKDFVISNNRKFKHGAFLIDCKGATICKARNTSEHHAEVNVINKYISNNLIKMSEKKIMSKLRKLTILVINVKDDGRLIMSMPCAHCVFNIKRVGIKNVLYSTNGAVIKKKSTELDMSYISSGNRFRSRRVDYVDTII